MALLKVSLSPATIGFTTFTIIAREGLEAIVILAALLAGLRGAENLRIRHGIVKGALLGVAASGLTFWLSQTIVRSLLRFGEKLEAVVSVLAVFILLMVTNWVFHKMYWVGWNARLRDLSKSAQAVRAPVWEIGALLGVGFLTVYREGFETTIFMQSLMLEGSAGSVLLGATAGFAFIAAIGMLIMAFGAKLPYRKMLVFTGVLVVSIMVTFLGSTVRLFQTVSWLPVHPLPRSQAAELARRLVRNLPIVGRTAYSAAGPPLRRGRLALRPVYCAVGASEIWHAAGPGTGCSDP